MGKRTDWTEKPERSRGRQRGRSLLRWLTLVVVLLAVGVAVKVYVAEPFSIATPSMEPALSSRDRVVIEKLRYRLADPHRGDVIVFDKPANAGGSADVENLVQRIIARPGDEIEARDGIVYLNGQVLDEPYLRPGTVTSDIARQRLPDGRYWVMGDDRQISEDSRQFGPIPESAILGRAIFRFWPWSTMGGI